MHIGVAADCRHDRGAAATREAADFVDDVAPVRLPERRVAFRNIHDPLARQIALEYSIGGARIDVIRSHQEKAADAPFAQEVDCGNGLLRRRRARIEDVA
jgi:hypothetical protein